MADLLQYVCPCCSGKIEFNSATQTMKCPFCEAEFDVDTVQQFNEQLSGGTESNTAPEAHPAAQFQQANTSGMKVYSCTSCGAEIVVDETTGASKCPYCESPLVLGGNFAGEFKPDYIIPFKLDKEAAKSAFAKHLNGKFLLPKVFKSENHIDEIKGVYVPVWLFDVEAEGHMTYKGEKRRTWSDSEYKYTEISYYNCVREGTVFFEKVPVDGSSKIPDDLMESLEPFDFKDAVDFKAPYLAGYVADKYDVASNNCTGRANDRVKKSAADAFRETVQGMTNVSTESSNISVSDNKAKYALYPVWLLHTTWKDKKYTFAMNGQTGKFVGDLPCDKSRSTKLFAAVTVLSTALYLCLAKLFGMM